VARNRRRQSSKNYKGVAKVTTRRARKGFELRYNPDKHGSSALYRGLNLIHYTDGSDILNINRDDASGFRLDTLATHSQHGTPAVSGNNVLTGLSSLTHCACDTRNWVLSHTHTQTRITLTHFCSCLEPGYGQQVYKYQRP